MAKKRKVITYCCEQSAVKAAASPEAARLLEKVDMITVPCSGSVETRMLLEQIEHGASGVIVLACPIDNCTYLDGNRRARTRVRAARKALADAGMDMDTVRIEFISSLDTHKLVSILKEI